MMDRNTNMMRFRVDQKTLDAIRSNAVSIADVEASERSQRTIAADENNQDVANSPIQYDDGSCKLLGHAVRRRVTSPLPTVKEVQAGPSSSSDEEETVAMDRNVVENLNNAASGHALRGNEAVSIRLYKRALTLTTEEVGRIQRRMEKCRKEPEYLQDTIYQLLSKEWTEVAFMIAEIKTMMAIIYERTGDYDRAIKACKEARDVYQRQLRRDSTLQSDDFPNAKENLEMMTQMAAKLDEAAQTYDLRRDLHEEALKIHEQIKTTKKPSVRERLFEAAFDKVSAALNLELENLGKNHPQVSETLAFLSKLHLLRNDRHRAILAMERAANVAEVALGPQHPRTGAKFYELARQYESADRDKYDKSHAALFYEKALDIYKEAEGDYSRIIAVISNDLGVLYIQQGQVNQAIERLNEALAIYESSIDKFNVVCAESAQVWRNLAECYVVQKQWDLAIVYFSNALAVQRDARELYDNTKTTAPNIANFPFTTDEDIADTMKRLGKAYAAKHQYDKACGVLLEALTIFQGACEQAKARVKKISSLDLADKQDEIANIIYCLAEVKEADNKNDEAEKLYEEALQLRLHSDKIRPKDKMLNHVHIAMSLAGIGNMRMVKGEYEQAFKAYNEAIQSTRKQDLPEYHPIVQMLWDRSRKARQKMTEENNSRKVGQKMTEENDSTLLLKETESETVDSFAGIQLLNTDDGVNGDGEELSGIGQIVTGCLQLDTWYQTASRLEKKARAKKEKGDINGAIEDTKHVLEFRKAYLAKTRENKKPTAKSGQQVAHTLVELAKLQLIKEDVGEAEDLFREAMDIYKSIGLSKSADCVQEIKRELDRLKWQGRTQGRLRSSCIRLR